MEDREKGNREKLKRKEKERAKCMEIKGKK